MREIRKVLKSRLIESRLQKQFGAVRYIRVFSDFRTIAEPWDVPACCMRSSSTAFDIRSRTSVNLELIERDADHSPATGVGVFSSAAASERTLS
jgi:hypothetical protein